MNDELAILHFAQQLADRHEGKLDLVGDVASRRVAAAKQKLQDQRLDFAVGQPGGAERIRLDRHERLLDRTTRRNPRGCRRLTPSIEQSGQARRPAHRSASTADDGLSADVGGDNCMMIREVIVMRLLKCSFSVGCRKSRSA